MSDNVRSRSETAKFGALQLVEYENMTAKDQEIFIREFLWKADEMDHGHFREDRTLYEIVVDFAECLKNRSDFFCKNGRFNESAFYHYAILSYDTWYGVKTGLRKPEEKTMLRLVVALRLSLEDAKAFLDYHDYKLESWNETDQIGYTQKKFIKNLIEMNFSFSPYGIVTPEAFKDILLYYFGSLSDTIYG